MFDLPYPERWKNGIAVSQAAAINISGFDLEKCPGEMLEVIQNNLSLLQVSDEHELVLTPRIAREIFIRMALNRWGGMPPIGTSEDGEPTFNVIAVFRSLNIRKYYYYIGDSRKIEKEYSSISDHNRRDVEACVKLYNDSLAMARWLMIPAWNLSAFVNLMLYRAPESPVFLTIGGHASRASQLYVEMDKALKLTLATGEVNSIGSQENGELGKDENVYRSIDLILWAKRIGYRLPDYLLALLEEDKKPDNIDLKTINLEALDACHEYFSRELSIALQCWQVFFCEGSLRKNTGFGKQAKKWLKDNYPDLTQNAIDRIVSVTTPDGLKKGGAPKSE